MRVLRVAMWIAVSAISTLSPGHRLQGSEAGRPPAQPGTAQWTVMIFMNGKNDIEEDAKHNYEQIRRVGSTEDVNIVVELGLLTWDHVYRIRAAAAATLGASGPAQVEGVIDLGKVNMGSREALSHFIAGTKRDYPAARYLLIIWHHGQGWRYYLSQFLASERN